MLLLLIRLPFESSSGRDGDHEVDEVDDSGDQAEAAHREGSVVIPGIVCGSPDSGGNLKKLGVDFINIAVELIRTFLGQPQNGKI